MQTTTNNSPSQSRWATAGKALLFFLIGLVGFVGSMIAAQLVLRQVKFGSFGRLLFHALSAIVVFLISWLFCRVVDKRPWVSIGYRLHDAWRRTWQGLVIGVVMMTTTVLLGLLTGTYSVHWNWPGSRGLTPWLIYLVAMALVAFTEEALFRGYVLQGLATGLGRWPAAMITAVIFGAMHLTNPGSGLGSTLGITVIGIGFTYLILETGSMWMAMAVHLSWNLFEGAVYGLPNSGAPERFSILATTAHGPEWWTGGSFGPEAGVISAIATVVGLLLFRWWERRRA